MKENICAFADLQSYHDRQLANTGIIVNELVGRNRKAMKLFTKIIPKFEHYTSTECGVSSHSYSREYEKLAGIG